MTELGFRDQKKYLQIMAVEINFVGKRQRIKTNINIIKIRSHLVLAYYNNYCQLYKIGVSFLKFKKNQHR